MDGILSRFVNRENLLEKIIEENKQINLKLDQLIEELKHKDEILNKLFKLLE